MLSNGDALALIDFTLSRALAANPFLAGYNPSHIWKLYLTGSNPGSNIAVDITHPQGVWVERVKMFPEVKDDALKRMSYIEGHLAGIRKMLEEDKYCVDVLKQTYAVRRAIEKMESLLLEGHLKSCVVDGIRSGRAEAIVDELKDLYILSNK